MLDLIASLLEELLGSFVWTAIIVLIVFLVINRTKNKASKDSSAEYLRGYQAGMKSMLEKVELRINRGEEINLKTVAYLKRIKVVLKDKAEIGSSESDNTKSKALKTDSAIKAEDKNKHNADTKSLIEEKDVLGADQKNSSLINGLSITAIIMFIAAGIAMIVSDFPDLFKLIGVLFITISFYAIGICTTNIPRLKQTSLIFIVTSLSLIPFLGIVFNKYGGLTGEKSWMLTSFVGVACYVLATLRLKSQVVSYLSIGFIMSLVASVVPNSNLNFVWYFVLLITFSLCCSLISFVKPKVLPELFVKPITQTGNIGTPILILVSLFSGSELILLDYILIFGLSTIQYVISYLNKPSYLIESVIRVLANITAILVAYDYSSDNLFIGMAISILAIINACYSIYRYKGLKNGKTSDRQLELVWYVFSLIYGYSAIFYWTGQYGENHLQAFSYGLVTLLAVLMAFINRVKVFAYLSVLTFSRFLVLNFVSGEEILENYQLGYLFVILAAGILAVCRYRFCNLGKKSYVCLSTFTSFWFILNAYILGLELTDQVSLILYYSIIALMITEITIIHFKQFITLAYVFVIPVIASALARYLFEPFTLMHTITSFALTGAIFAIIHLLFSNRYRVVQGVSLIYSYIFFTLMGFAFHGMGHDLVRVYSYVLLLILSIVAYGQYLVSRKNALVVFKNIHLIFSFVLLFVASSFSWFVLNNNLLFASAIFLAIAYLIHITFMTKRYGLQTISSLLLMIATMAVVDNYLSNSDYLIPVYTVTLGSFFFLLYFVSKLRENRVLKKIMFNYGIATLILGVAFCPSVTEVRDFKAVFICLIGLMLLVKSMLHDTKKEVVVGSLGIYTVALGLANLLDQVFVDNLVPITVYGHILAIAVLVTAYMYGNLDRKLKFVFAFITIFGGLSSLAHAGIYSGIFILEHIVMITYGAYRNKNWLIWWGIIASSIASIWSLKTIPFMAFLIFGVTIVLVIIWQINKSEKVKAKGKRE